MEWLIFLIHEFWKFLAPMLKAYLYLIKVKILNMIIVRIDNLLKDSSTLKVHLFVIFIGCCDTS
jgi:hypothetical protein